MQIMKFIKIIKINFWTQNKPIGLSLKLKSFELTQISISVGRSYIIEYQYKLLASKYMIHEVGLLISYGFKDLLLASA